MYISNLHFSYPSKPKQHSDEAYHLPSIICNMMISLYYHGLVRTFAWLSLSCSNCCRLGVVVLTNYLVLFLQKKHGDSDGKLRCEVCKDEIKGQVIRAVERAFCATCFKCSVCQKDLASADVGFTADADKKLFCQKCYSEWVYFWSFQLAIHIFSKAQVTSNKKEHKKRQHFLARPFLWWHFLFVTTVSL